LLATNAFIYFKESKENTQFLTYPSEKLIETVGASISLLSLRWQRLFTWGQLKRRLQLPSRRQLSLDGLGLLVVRSTAKFSVTYHIPLKHNYISVQ